MKLNDSEWTVMNVLWVTHPASARDVLDAVEPETLWAYSTVKTLLSRLVEKGAVREHKRANTSIYEPNVSRDKARKAAVRSLLDKAFGGALEPFVQHLVTAERLSKRDRAKLAQMLADDDAGAKR